MTSNQNDSHYRSKWSLYMLVGKFICVWDTTKIIFTSKRKEFEMWF